MPIPLDFSPPQTRDDEIDVLIHLYIDGGMKRRDLIGQVARLAGGTAAAMVILEREGLAQVSLQDCPANIKVAENDKSVQWEEVSFPSDSQTIRAILARPAAQKDPQPAILVIHENRGLTDHIRDVTRRAAKAGYVALGIDLLSRQGGSKQYPDDQQRVQAYSKTVPAERYQDILAGIAYLQKQPFVIPNRTGAVGFCAGGGNAYMSVFQGAPIQAAVAFYGSPPNPLPAPDNVKTPVLCVFSENDRNQAARISELTNALVGAHVTFDVVLYKGTSHGFHNDTSPIYNAAAACDAWARTIGWFHTHLRG